MQPRKGKCDYCHADIIWIKTPPSRKRPSGSWLPCDPTLLSYAEDPKGPEKFVTFEGQVVSGWRPSMRPDKVPTGLGYVPHFATCPPYLEFQRRRRLEKQLNQTADIEAAEQLTLEV